MNKAVEVENLAALLNTGRVMKQFLKRFVREDSGQDMIEYVLVATLLGLSSLAVVRAYNLNITGTLNSLGTRLTNAIPHVGG